MKKEIEKHFGDIGGIVPIGDSFAPMTDDELSSVQSDVGNIFAEDYREFLKTYGQSSFGAVVNFRPIQQLPIWISKSGRGPFSHFYGAKGGVQSLVKSIKAFKGRMPDLMIPIGDDGMGNQICLSIGGDLRGKVYYWDHENEWDEEDYLEDHGKPMPPEGKFQNVYLIANSFEDFILCLALSMV